MNPNPFRFRLITLDEVSMPVGNGQIVGLQRFLFNGNALNGLLCAVFGKQPASRFQIFRFNPFAVRIKRVDAVGNKGLYFTEAVWNFNINGFLIRIAVLGGNGFVSSFSACLVLGEDAVADSDMGDGFVAFCRFDQGAAVEGAGVGFLKNLVFNILLQMKERSSEN